MHDRLPRREADNRKHRHAVSVLDGPSSSFRRWLRLGAYPVDWAGDPSDEARSCGEK